MSEGYFQRVTKQTPTRLRINNPTPEEASKAIASGAITCTTNPKYCMKQHIRESEQNEVNSIIDKIVKEIDDDNLAADLIQQKLVPC